MLQLPHLFLLITVSSWGIETNSSHFTTWLRNLWAPHGLAESQWCHWKVYKGNLQLASFYECLRGLLYDTCLWSSVDVSWSGPPSWGWEVAPGIRPHCPGIASKDILPSRLSHLYVGSNRSRKTWNFSCRKRTFTDFMYQELIPYIVTIGSFYKILRSGLLTYRSSCKSQGHLLIPFFLISSPPLPYPITSIDTFAVSHLHAPPTFLTSVALSSGPHPVFPASLQQPPNQFALHLVSFGPYPFSMQLREAGECHPQIYHFSILIIWG